MIRIKRYFRIYEDKDKLIFAKTPFSGIIMDDTIVVRELLYQLCLTNNEEEVIENISTKYKLESSVVSLLIDGLIEKGLVERYILHEDMSRFDRQLLFFDCLSPNTDFTINVKQQKALSEKHIVLIGIGGIGNYASISLIASGSKKITIIDGDIIELSNLNRQILFNETEIGKSKVEVAKTKLNLINNSTQINIENKDIKSEKELFDCLDQFCDIDFIFLSADYPVEIVLWVDSYLKKRKNIGFMPCGYMGNVGIIGPILTSNSKSFIEIYPDFNKYKYYGKNKKNLTLGNNTFVPPSCSASNAIFSNIAVLEMQKYLLLANSILIEKRMFFDLNDYSINYE